MGKDLIVVTQVKNGINTKLEGELVEISQGLGKAMTAFIMAQSGRQDGAIMALRAILEYSIKEAKGEL